MCIEGCTLSSATVMDNCRVKDDVLRQFLHGSQCSVQSIMELAFPEAAIIYQIAQWHVLEPSAIGVLEQSDLAIDGH